MKQKRVWISWETQRRTTELSKILKCNLKIIEIEGVLRYPVSIIKTILFILREKPDILFVQNPSMILATIAGFFCTITKLPLVVDRHTTFLIDKPIIRNKMKKRIFQLLHFYTISVANLTIVTNDYLSELTEKAKGKPFVLPDPLPNFFCCNAKKSLRRDLFKILIPNSFAQDEPLDRIISASKLLANENFHFFVTGSTKRMPSHLKNISFSNITFTGFLPDQDYIDLLFSVEGVMVLTTATSTMLCGCYEAVAAEKPLITSNKPCLSDYFTGALFVDNSPEEIATACRTIKNNTQEMINRAKGMKETLSFKWNQDLQKLELILSEIV
ncbi:MAG: glycosyltransferase [Chitinispirillaceae bacterium]|nr:glycosyltransferase [Chitinispirillaceae bacterium]